MIPGKLYKIIHWDGCTAYDIHNNKIRLPLNTILFFLRSNPGIFDDLYFMYQGTEVSIHTTSKTLGLKIQPL